MLLKTKQKHTLFLKKNYVGLGNQPFVLKASLDFLQYKWNN